jgi:hypothetical protein
VYDYPLTPKTLGFVPDENALPQYTGFAVPNVIKLIYSSIRIEMSLVSSIPYTGRDGALYLSYVDGLELKLDLKPTNTSNSLCRIVCCDNVVADVKADGVSGVAICFQETTRGVVKQAVMKNWKGGSDSPFITMLMCSMHYEYVEAESQLRSGNVGAISLNTSIECSVSNIRCKNFATAAHLGFSKGSRMYNVHGQNVDVAANVYSSSCATISHVTLDGYFLVNETTPLSRVNVHMQDVDRPSYQHIRRLNDKGYGVIRAERVRHAVLDHVDFPETDFEILLSPQAHEYALPPHNHALSASNVKVRDVIRRSNYYDPSNEFSRLYPYVEVQGSIRNLVVGARSCYDTFDVQANGDVTFGAKTFGTIIRGFVAGNVTVSLADSGTCFPNAKGLIIGGNVTGFQSLSGYIASPSSLPPYFYNGALLTDMTNMRTYLFSGNRTAGGVLNPA